MLRKQVISWAVAAVQAQYKAGTITDIEKGPLLDQLTRFRAAMGALYDYQGARWCVSGCIGASLR